MSEKGVETVFPDRFRRGPKEAFFFRVPCVTLRKETEWVETVETGWNVLVGCDPSRIIQATLEAQSGMESAWPYGDGRSGERIVRIFIDKIEDFDVKNGALGMG